MTMTTIACDGKTVAADGLLVAGDEPMQWNKTKIVRCRGNLYGYTGAIKYMRPMIEWHSECRSDSAYPAFAADDNGSLVVFYPTYCESFSSGSPYPALWKYPFTTGTGQDFARMALECGLSPEEAVRRTMKFDLKTGGEVTVLDLVEAAEETVVAMPVAAE